MEKEVGFVYKWYDTLNDMYYIGSHRGDVNDGYKGSGKLFKKEYSERPSDFFREILYVGELYQLYEETILTYLNARDDSDSYNLKNKALGAGFCHTDESKRKISEAGKGRRQSKKTKEAISRYNKSKVVSRETRDKISKAFKGKTLTNEHKRKISQGIKNTDKLGWRDGRRMMKPVYSEVDKTYFESRNKAAEYYGISGTYCGNMINGKKKNKYGLRYVPKEEYGMV